MGFSKKAIVRRSGTLNWKRLVFLLSKILYKKCETVVFKPADDSLEKFIPRTKLLGEDKFEIPVRRDDQE